MNDDRLAISVASLVQQCAGEGMRDAAERVSKSVALVEAALLERSPSEPIGCVFDPAACPRPQAWHLPLHRFLASQFWGLSLRQTPRGPLALLHDSLTIEACRTILHFVQREVCRQVSAWQERRRAFVFHTAESRRLAYLQSLLQSFFCRFETLELTRRRERCWQYPHEAQRLADRCARIREAVAAYARTHCLPAGWILNVDPAAPETVHGWTLDTIPTTGVPERRPVAVPAAPWTPRECHTKSSSSSASTTRWLSDR